MLQPNSSAIPKRPKRLVIIPARANSTRLQNKHQQELNGNPLIHYTFETALQLKQQGHVDEILFSTDSAELMKLALSYALSIPSNCLRPEHLAKDETPTIDVIRWVIQTQLSPEDCERTQVILLQATSPLRTASQVIDALSLLDEVPRDHSLVSVTPSKPVHWQGSIYGPTQRFQQCSPFQQCSAMCSTGANDLSQHVVLNGAIYIAMASELRDKNFLEMPCIAYVMSPETSIDIDTESDLLMADALLTYRTKRYTRNDTQTPGQALDTKQLKSVLNRFTRDKERPIHLRHGGKLTPPKSSISGVSSGASTP